MFPLPFPSKIKRVLDVDKYNNPENIEERVPLEKGDKTAIAIAAVIVFLPVIIILCGVFYALGYLFSR